jgi:hypothetical protein
MLRLKKYLKNILHLKTIFRERARIESKILKAVSIENQKKYGEEMCILML